MLTDTRTASVEKKNRGESQEFKNWRLHDIAAKVGLVMQRKYSFIARLLCIVACTFPIAFSDVIVLYSSLHTDKASKLVKSNQKKNTVNW